MNAPVVLAKAAPDGLLEVVRDAVRLPQGARIVAAMSGGVDSTLALVSLLKNATPEQKKNVVVLMSEESITEYPGFYRDHIHGKLRAESSGGFPLLLGGNHLIVNGEHNDQLFGSDIVAKFIGMFGTSAMHQSYSRDTLSAFYNSFLNDEGTTHFYMDLFERVKAAAPVPISTNYLFFWWINFALKWQTVSIRTLTFASARNVEKITLEYTANNYAPFYRTDEFQLWSMNNLDKRIKGTWKSYKWIVKDFIYEYTKDAEYRDNKIKHASRYFLLLYQRPYTQITEDMGAEGFKRDHSLAAYHDPVNDFI